MKTFKVGYLVGSLSSTSTYSDKISSVRSQTNVGASVHAASRVALGLSVGSPRNPDTPATRTEVSTTPLGGCFHRFGDKRQLRLSAFTTIRLDRFGNVCLRHALEIICALLDGSAQFLFPPGSLATAWEIPCLFCERQAFIQFRYEPA